MALWDWKSSQVLRAEATSSGAQEQLDGQDVMGNYNGRTESLSQTVWPTKRKYLLSDSTEKSLLTPDLGHFKLLFVYLFIYLGCVGSLLLRASFL